MTGAVAAAHRSGSIYVAAASRVLAIIYAGSIALWLTGRGVWRYALLELFALVYFYLRWSAREAQHRQFHFLLLCCYVMTTAFYAYRFAVQPLMPDAFAMSPWWYQLMHNLIFAAELLFVVSYALLYRRAQADRKQYYDDVERWFARAGAMKRGLFDGLRQTLFGTRKE